MEFLSGLVIYEPNQLPELHKHWGGRAHKLTVRPPLHKGFLCVIQASFFILFVQLLIY